MNAVEEDIKSLLSRDRTELSLQDKELPFSFALSEVEVDFIILSTIGFTLVTVFVTAAVAVAAAAAAANSLALTLANGGRPLLEFPTPTPPPVL